MGAGTGNRTATVPETTTHVGPGTIGETVDVTTTEEIPDGAGPETVTGTAGIIPDQETIGTGNLLTALINFIT